MSMIVLDVCLLTVGNFLICLVICVLAIWGAKILWKNIFRQRVMRLSSRVFFFFFSLYYCQVPGNTTSPGCLPAVPGVRSPMWSHGEKIKVSAGLGSFWGLFGGLFPALPGSGRCCPPSWALGPSTTCRASRQGGVPHVPPL